MAYYSTRLVLSAAVFFAGIMTASAQSVPPVLQVVVDQCADAPDGTCLQSSQAYVAGLEAQALTAIGFTQSMATYVLAIVEVTQEDPVCNAIDFAVADSLESAAPHATDIGQGANMLEIARALRQCETFQTAAVGGEPVSPN